MATLGMIMKSYHYKELDLYITELEAENAILKLKCNKSNGNWNVMSNAENGVINDFFFQNGSDYDSYFV